MNALEKAESLGLTGTDAEITAVLRTLTIRDIPIADVSAWLRERQLWIETPDGSTGALHQIYAKTENQLVKRGIAELFASVFRGQAQSLRTSRPDIAGRVAGVMQIIRAAIDPTGTIETELYALAGGRPWIDTTAEKLAEQRGERDAFAQKQVALDRVVVAMEAAQAEFRKAESTAETIVDAARKSLGGM